MIHSRPHATPPQVRLSTRLTLALMVTSGLILSAYGVQLFRHEEAELREATEHDLRLLAASIQVAVENALRDGQKADVTEIVDALELKDQQVRVFVFDEQGEVAESSLDAVRPFDGAALAAARVLRERKPIFEFEVDSNVSRAWVVVPLENAEGRSGGALAVIRPLDAVRADLFTTATSSALSIATVFLGLAIVAGVLVQLTVSRPLGNLLEVMRAVRKGNLTATAGPARNDELGLLAAEFNAMLEELRRTHARLISESEARQSLEAGLARIDKMVTLGQLSAGLAHEIGSPLQVLNGRARALAARADASPEVRRTAQILVEQSERIGNIVGQLLDFARKKVPRLGPADVVAPVGRVVQFLESEAKRRAVSVTFSHETLPQIIADAEQVQQATLNLLTNALRASPKNSTVEVKLERASFEPASGGAARASVRLSVVNHGPPIAPEALPRLFEPFFTTWQDTGGTGLGLAVVKSISDEHGGTVVVDSREGYTCFSVHFPVDGQRQTLLGAG